MQIQIRIADQVVCEIELEQDTSLHRGLALKWSHVLGNRQRWKHRCKNKEQVHEKACAALETLGVTADHLETIGNAKVIEIRFPDATEDELWACEAFPWEHWISAATGNTSIVVVRHMAVDRKATTRKPKTFALVESSPGEFQGVKNFATEREFVGFGLRSLSESDISNDPTEEELAKQIAAAEPDVIHFTAVDNSLGRQLDWGYATEEMKFYKSIYNGACFKTTRKLQKSDLKHLEEVVWPRQEKAGTEVEKEVDRRRISVHREVNARNVAEYLNAAKTKPLLISLNNWYSNSRTASRCIAEGAGAVLCFHNSIDESIARRFYCEFYYRWASLDFDILAAYAIAIEKIRPMTDHVNGEAVVLWTAESLVERKPESANANPAATPKVFPDPSVDRIQDLVGVNVRPPKYINYSMLHNGRSLLEKLELWFRFPDRAAEQAPNCIRGIDVEVSLQVGPDSFPFEAQVELGIDNPEVDLAAESIFKDGNESRGGISVPLISKLARNLGEAVQTTILVQVKWNGQTLYRQTHAVTLSPANAWRLDDRDTCWIPSFVQPRAPAVSEIIGSAQKYLRCLEDDQAASFKAYQADDVNLQVRAIWTAIAFDYSIDYTEPPPSYRLNSQRLRTPCQVLKEKRGTCIDLSLLFASCLEWIGVYPVLINNDGHTYPGYWTSEEAHTEFFEMLHKQQGDQVEQEDFDVAKVGIGTQLPWVADHDAFSLIQKLVHPLKEDGCTSEECEQASATEVPGLRVLEATFLPKRKGLKEAFDENVQFFCPRSGYYSKKPEAGDPFAALIDIKSARSFVTPLPIY